MKASEHLLALVQFQRQLLSDWTRLRCVLVRHNIPVLVRLSRMRNFIRVFPQLVGLVLYVLLRRMKCAA